MTHLSSEALRDWCDEGRAVDRAPVLEHLAVCEECRRALSALARESTPLDPPSIVRPRDVRERGRAAGPSSVYWWRFGPWMSPAYAVVGLLVIAVAAAGLWRVAAGRDDHALDVRGTSIQLIEPTSRASGAFDFRWTSPFEASAYRLTVADAQGATVTTVTTRAPAIPVPPDLARRLQPDASYSWQVEALDAEGRVIAASPRATFRFER